MYFCQTMFDLDLDFQPECELSATPPLIKFVFTNKQEFMNVTSTLWRKAMGWLSDYNLFW